MARPALDRAEILLRAIQEAHLDPTTKQASSRLFLGPDTSLSRLAILPKDAIFEVFRRQLKNPAAPLLGAARVSVAVIQDAGDRDEHGKPKIVVEADPVGPGHPAYKVPEDENPAHAEIPGKVPRGVSLKIIKGIEQYFDAAARPVANIVELSTSKAAQAQPVVEAQPPATKVLSAPVGEKGHRSISLLKWIAAAIIVALIVLLLLSR